MDSDPHFIAATVSSINHCSNREDMMVLVGRIAHEADRHAAGDMDVIRQACVEKFRAFKKEIQSEA